MKFLILLSLFTLTSIAFAAEWKTIAETTNCPDATQIMAKDGEKFVKAVTNGKEEMLYSQDGSVFKSDSPKTTFFASRKEGSAGTSVTFTQPGMVESNTPKLDIVAADKKSHCNMKSK